MEVRTKRLYATATKPLRFSCVTTGETVKCKRAVYEVRSHEDAISAFAQRLGAFSIVDIGPVARDSDVRYWSLGNF